jgi:hypothetical protein
MDLAKELAYELNFNFYPTILLLFSGGTKFSWCKSKFD